MKLTFIGATHEVTGSCYFLNACGKNILIDCGMEQGRDEFENQELAISPSELDCVLLTHAHLDHSGNLPLLYKNGFRGKIYATEATCDLCNIMLRDSAHIQEFEAEWRNRRAKRSGSAEYVPIYTMDDALGAIGLLTPCGYKSFIDIFDGVTVCFSDMGHLLGSACIEVWAQESGEKRKIVFSGDIGNTEQPILKEPTYIPSADYAVIESTYGNRSHGARPDYVSEFASVLQRTFDRGGNVVIPSFAVGRTQEILYFLRCIKADGRIKGHDGFSVFVDSPLAIESTKVFRQNAVECFDDETKALIDSGVNPLSFEGLSMSVTAEESKAINSDKKSKVIISASGMCDAGRIRHHLRHNLQRAESTVLFVGYQAEGTVGRMLSDGAKSVKLFGEQVSVKAEIAQLNGVSGHADSGGLMKWASAFGASPKRFFVTHGDDEACTALRDRIQDELKISADAPYSGECWDLIENKKDRI
ncbi:MAG: MBL fold metallo-hydrolase [Oscillospiraceae bacterium]